MEGDRYLPAIRPLLSEKRFLHSLEVAKQAARLAENYGCSVERAYTAGILHDCMKDTNGEEQLQIIEKSGIIFGNMDRAIPKVWHAKAAAAYARDILGVEDAEILAAIACHTTGKAGMSLFEKVLFLADYTSAERDYPGADEMRRLAEEDLNGAMYRALAFSITDLAERAKLVHPDTLFAYNEVIAEEITNQQA